MRKVLAEISYIETRGSGFGSGNDITRIKECEILEEKEKVVLIHCNLDWDTTIEQWIKKEKILEEIK